MTVPAVPQSAEVQLEQRRRDLLVGESIVSLAIDLNVVRRPRRGRYATERTEFLTLALSGLAVIAHNRGEHDSPLGQVFVFVDEVLDDVDLLLDGVLFISLVVMAPAQAHGVASHPFYRDRRSVRAWRRNCLHIPDLLCTPNPTLTPKESPYDRTADKV